MMDGYLIKRLDKKSCLEYREGYLENMDLTNRRLGRLRDKSKQNPNWKGFNPYADEQISIGVYIEEQEAVRDELKWYLDLIESQLQTLELKEKNPNCKIVKQGVVQLSLL